MSVNIYHKDTDTLEQVAGNADSYINDSVVSQKTTYSSKKIDSELFQIREGKNWLNLKTWVDGEYYTETNGKLNVLKADQRGWNLIKKMKLSGNTEYTISTENACNIYYGLDDVYGANIQNARKLTFTTSDSGVVTLKFLASSYPFEVGYVQIEKGSQATGYAEYSISLKTLNEEKLSAKNILYDGDDLNSITTSGIYQIAGKNVLNAPSDFYSSSKIFGFIEVIEYGDYISQQLTIYYNGASKVAYRRFNNTWGNWTEIATTDKTLTNNSSGYISTSGTKDFTLNNSSQYLLIAGASISYIPTWSGAGSLKTIVTDSNVTITMSGLKVTVTNKSTTANQYYSLIKLA